MPIVISVFSIIIAEILLRIFTSLTIWEIIKSLPGHFAPFLLASVQVRVWYIFLAGLTIIALFALFKCLRNYPIYKIDGLYWECTEQEYTGDSYPNLKALCPKCMGELKEKDTNPHPTENLAKRFIGTCTLHCQHCNQFEKFFKLSYPALLERIDKEIDRRMLIRYHPLKRVSCFLKKQTTRGN